METLEELRNKYKKLQEESNNIYSKIRALEKKEARSKFTVGDCYIDKVWNYLLKIVSIKNNWIYFICLKRDSISRYVSNIYDIRNWEKITSEQFKNAYLAVIKDLQDPDFKDKEESNWDIVYNSIVTSVNKESNEDKD
jgi:hypothetical protein